MSRLSMDDINLSAPSRLVRGGVARVAHHHIGPLVDEFADLIVRRVDPQSPEAYGANVTYDMPLRRAKPASGR